MSITAESFAKDVKAHQLTVYKNDGVYRHMHIGNPKTFCMSYQLTTWPGHLAYTGDMGSFIFTRTNDMFDFFRGDRINPQYWAEKLEAIDRQDGLMQYSPRRAREYIAERLDDIEADNAVRKAAEAITTDEGEDEFRRQLRDFTGHPRIFRDSWEARFWEYSPRFLWCCYAIIHGIKLYDDAKAGEALPTMKPPKCGRCHDTGWITYGGSFGGPAHRMPCGSTGCTAALRTDGRDGEAAKPSGPSFIAGAIVRYAEGPTALMRIDEWAANGRAYGRQCMGGTVGAWPDQMRQASVADLRTWKEHNP